MASMIVTLENAARDGDRVIAIIDGKPSVLWAGLGNRTGLHSFASELLSEKWEKSGARFIAKVQALKPGTAVEILRFRNVTRDRGAWVRAVGLKVAKGSK